MKKLTKLERLEFSATIYESMIDGDTDEEIRSRLALDAETFQGLKREMLSMKAQDFRQKTQDELYIEYRIEQLSTIKKLDDLTEGLDSAKQYNAVVGALRLRTDIVDKLIKTGQDFGVLKRTATQHDIVIGGHIIAEMDTKQLRSHIVEMARGAVDMMKRYGERPLSALPEPTIYSGEGVEVATEEKVVKLKKKAKKKVKKK